MYNYDTYFNDSDEFIYSTRSGLMVLVKVKEKHRNFSKMRVNGIDFFRLCSCSDGYFVKDQEDIQHIYKVISWFRGVI